MGKSKTLLLSLKKEWFDIMITGEKHFEIREKTKWIESRLFYKNGHEKEYDFVKFINGYGNDKPFFICEFDRAREITEMNKTFSNGSKLVFENNPVWQILLGDVLEKGNLKN